MKFRGRTGWVGLSLILAAQGLQADLSSTSEVQVATAVTLAGGQGGVPKVSCFSLSMVAPLLCVGTISSRDAHTLTDESAAWREEDFTAAGSHCYVEFENGLMADVTAADPSTKTLALAGQLPDTIAAGQAYRLRRHLTLADVLGPNNEAGLLGGLNSWTADNVLLHVPQTQETLTYFYCTVTGLTGWRRSDYKPGADAVIYPGQGLMVRKRTESASTLRFCGTAKDTLTQTPVFRGYNLVGTLKGRRSLKLSELNLFTGDPGSGLAAGNNPSAADNLIVVHPDASTSTYFVSDLTWLSGWLDATYRRADSVLISPGSAFFVLRKAPRGLFYWSIPAEP
jgi:hypothetical protein